MIDKRVIEQVVQEQKLELEAYAQEEYCTRREESLVDVDSKRAQVVVGVRRSGKSVLCYHILRKHEKDFAYVNFDDGRCAPFPGGDGPRHHRDGREERYGYSDVSVVLREGRLRA